MKKGKKDLVTVVVSICICLFLLAGMFGRDYLKQKKLQRERTARKARVNKLWQQYLEKDPNEEELWTIVREHRSFDLMKLATETLLPITNSEERLLYLLEEHEYNTELRIKISDRLLECSSVKALKKIIGMVPERAENALLVLLEIAEPNDIELDCLKDVIIDIPSHRKWAWDKILSKTDQIKPSLCWVFAADPNYPEEIANAYFRSNLKPEHYRELMFYVPSLSDRALKEFLATKPRNEDLRQVIIGNQWNRHPKKEVKVEAAKYILANNPLESELDQIKKNCPTLRKEVRMAKNKILERKKAEQKIIPETKEGIIKAIEKIPY